MTIAKDHFGLTPAGEDAFLFSLANDQGLEVKVTNYGGIITSLQVPDRRGRLDDVVLGHDTLEGYLNRSRYFGALIGRYANRIAGGRFSLNGSAFSLAQNNGPNHLHGGFKGFDKVVWSAREINEPAGVGLNLAYRSKDGEEAYPGNLQVEVTYLLTKDNELRLEYRARTDRDTIVNLTNHSYFNLAGQGTVLDHELQIHADAFTPVQEGLIPSGEIRNVKNTPMDFTRPKSIGARINKQDPQIMLAGGYDHNFVLSNDGESLTRAARVYEPTSGRVFEVFTTQPGVQFYSGNFLDGSIIGKMGRTYVKHSGFCLETQHFPDSPNQPAFPSTVLKPAELYRQTTVWRFSVANGR